MNGLKDALNEFRFPDFEKKKKQQNSKTDMIYSMEPTGWRLERKKKRNKF